MLKLFVLCFIAIICSAPSDAAIRLNSGSSKKSNVHLFSVIFLAAESVPVKEAEELRAKLLAETQLIGGLKVSTEELDWLNDIKEMGFSIYGELETTVDQNEVSVTVRLFFERQEGRVTEFAITVAQLKIENIPGSPAAAQKFVEDLLQKPHQRIPIFDLAQEP